MAIEISTSTYEFSHGKKPRGRGFWIFQLLRTNGKAEETGSSGTYGEALKKAREEARKLRDVHEIKVMP